MFKTPTRCKLRLLLFEECDRACPGCCNNDWDLANLPVCESFESFDEILLTGGELMLHPDIVHDAIERIKRSNLHARIYLYTANVTEHAMVAALLARLDGLTVTLHNDNDIAPFLAFDDFLTRLARCMPLIALKSFRLNVFEEVQLPPVEGLIHSRWVVKSNISWITHCPLPAGEVFMRLSKKN
jgi:hypothetical protein